METVETTCRNEALRCWEVGPDGPEKALKLVVGKKAAWVLKEQELERLLSPDE